MPELLFKHVGNIKEHHHKFDGEHMTVAELKKVVFQRQHIREKYYDLKFVVAETKRKLEDGDIILPGTLVVYDTVKRVCAEAPTVFEVTQPLCDLQLTAAKEEPIRPEPKAEPIGPEPKAVEQERVETPVSHQPTDESLSISFSDERPHSGRDHRRVRFHLSEFEPLHCPLCSKLFVDPVVMFCCGNSYCHHCIEARRECPAECCKATELKFARNNVVQKTVAGLKDLREKAESKNKKSHRSGSQRSRQHEEHKERRRYSSYHGDQDRGRQARRSHENHHRERRYTYGENRHHEERMDVDC